MTARLPLTGATLCGYCERPLVLQPAGDWSCDRCRPLLAKLPPYVEHTRFVQAFATFQREAAKSRGKVAA